MLRNYFGKRSFYLAGVLAVGLAGAGCGKDSPRVRELRLGENPLSVKGVDVTAKYTCEKVGIEYCYDGQCFPTLDGLLKDVGAKVETEAKSGIHDLRDQDLDLTQKLCPCPKDELKCECPEEKAEGEKKEEKKKDKK